MEQSAAGILSLLARQEGTSLSQVQFFQRVQRRMEWAHEQSSKKIPSDIDLIRKPQIGASKGVLAAQLSPEELEESPERRRLRAM
jgi:hypothetical protein